MLSGVLIETLCDPVRYSQQQIENACAIAKALNRGKLILTEKPCRQP